MNKNAFFYIGEKTVPQQYIADLISRAVTQMKNFGIREKQIVCCQSRESVGIYVLYHAVMQLDASVLLVSGDYPATEKIQSGLLSADVLAVWKNGSLELIHREKNVMLEIPACSVLQMTSATTGEPKIVLRTRQQIDIELDRYIKHMNYGQREECFLPVVPFYHSYGFMCVMLVADRTGGTVILPDILLPRRVAELSERMNADYIYGVPYFLDAMLKIGSQYTLGSNLSRIISSGGKLSAETATELSEKFSVPVFQQYGSSETGSLTFGECTGDSTNVGKPIGDIAFYVIEENGQSMLYTDTKGSAGAYVSERDGIHTPGSSLYRTNDTGYIDDNGYVHITGRADDVIIIAGKKISRQRIQKVIMEISGIRKAVVSVSEKPPYDMICRYYADCEISETEIRKHCEKNLAGYEIPTKFLRSMHEIKSWKDGIYI